MRKYFKPKSVTWWASVVPLVLGLVLAFSPLYASSALVEIIYNLTGGTSPAMLINMGLAGIGIRGAID